jgi:hypothetical protein
MKDREVKQVFSGGAQQWKEEGIRKGWRRVKGGGGGRTVEEVNLIKIHCEHLCLCDNVYPVQNYYMLIKIYM